MENIGDNIKLVRERKSMTQLALAHAIGYKGDDAGACISRIESGQQEPRFSTLRKIASALGIEVDFLLRSEKEKKKKK